MNTPDTPDNLAKYIRDAAAQRRLMEPWLDDRRFVETGGKIAYAVDTDVINLFINPAERSIPQKHRGVGYATIFPDDDAARSIAIGQSLAEHIFANLAPDGGPLLVMPSLEAEIGRVFAAVAREAHGSENVARDEVAKLRATIKELGALTDRPEELAEELKKHAPELAKILRGALGPNAELHRFGRLFSDQRIAGLDFLAEHDEWYDAELRSLFPPVTNIPDLYRLTQLADDWREALRKTKYPKKYMDRVDDDAQALARLQWMNEKIDSERFRIVFITGDEALAEAAAKPNDANPRNFRDLYLRHPRAFMADDRVLFPWLRDDRENGRRTHDLTALLDLFLAEFPRENRLSAAHHDAVLEESEDSLRHICRAALIRFPNMVTDFREKWEDFTSDVSARSIPLDLTAENLGIGGDVASDIEQIMDKVEELLERRINEAWSACFDSATRAGFDILSSAKKGSLKSQPPYRPRNAPPLYFDRFRGTTAFVKGLLSTTGKVDPQKYQEALDKLTSEDEGIGYLYNLAFAVLFASMGRWPLTTILANRALQKATTGSDKRLSGREANYLKAVALRHTARNASDLDDVDAFIDKALGCLEADMEHHKGLEVWPIRFHIERTSAELALSLFSIFHQGHPTKGLQSLEDIQIKFQDHLGQISPAMKADMDPWIYLNVERNLLTNIFMTALLRAFHNREPVDTAALTSLFEQFESNLNDDSPQKIGVSYLVKAVYSVSKVWLGRGGKKLTRDTARLLSESAINDASTMPYDEKRFKFLRGIIERG